MYGFEKLWFVREVFAFVPEMFDRRIFSNWKLREMSCTVSWDKMDDPTRTRSRTRPYWGPRRRRVYCPHYVAMISLSLACVCVFVCVCSGKRTRARLVLPTIDNARHHRRPHHSVNLSYRRRTQHGDGTTEKRTTTGQTRSCCNIGDLVLSCDRDSAVL